MDKYHRLKLHVFIFFSSSNIAIYGGWWQSGGAAPQHSHVVPGQEDRQPLPQLPGNLLLLLSELSCQLPPKLDNNIQSSPVPAPEGVHSQGDEADGLRCVVLDHLGIEGMSHTTVPVLGNLVDKSTLQGVDDGDVQGSIFSLGPEGEEDVSWPII